jgi:RNAse (barnase) inhibitor barstar
MRTIELDATGWRTILDFYDAILPALGAPAQHGKNVNALVDSVVWGGLNKIEPPYTIRINHLGQAPKRIIDAVELAKHAVAEARAQYRTQYGRDIDVQIEIDA